MSINTTSSTAKPPVTNDLAPPLPDSPLGKNSKANEALPHKPPSNEMTTTEILLRGLYGAAACGIYVTGQRAIFGQSLRMKDLAIVATSCGIRAMAMGAVTKAVRESYKKTIPNANTRIKDIGEASIINAVETAVGYFQDKATAKDVDFVKILGLSSLKSFPNNLMDTQSYTNFIDNYSGKDKISENSTEEEKATVQRKESSIKFYINNLAALVTALPATYLNNEPLTPVNFAKTYLLRRASVALWRSAMDKAKADAGRSTLQETPYEAFKR